MIDDIDDLTQQELDALIEEVQKDDLEMVLIKERLRREALEKLVITLVDRVALLESQLRRHNLHHYS